MKFRILFKQRQVSDQVQTRQDLASDDIYAVLVLLVFYPIYIRSFHGKKVRLLYILNKRRSFALHYATTPIQMATALPKQTNNRMFLLGCSIHGLTGHGGLR
jgi:D-alanyl-lipoteichoic acid acyltransferase DltB (MBOAT superfamily)